MTTGTQRTATQRWFAQQAAREARIVVLEEALLGGRTVRYAAYRLRWFFATYLVESAAHAVLAVTLFTALPAEDVVLVVAAHAATLLVSHLWWGALEALRAQVRDLHRGARPHRIAAVIAGWLTASLLLAAGVAVAGVAVLALLGGSAVAGALVGTFLLRLVLDVPTRAFHSGVYAMRRVYKPLSATMAPHLAGLGLTLALVPAIGPWGLVVSSLVTTGLVTGLTLRYTGRIYRFLGISTRPEIGWPAMRAALRGSGREAAAAAAANAVIGLDALVVLALLFGAVRNPASLFVLFLTMPTIAAGAEWARLLYFDLKRLELRLFTNLRHRFELATEWLALALGVLFGLVAALLAVLGSVPSSAPALVAFLVARSALACAQIQAFADRSYRTVVGVGALAVVGFVAVGAAGGGEAGLAAVTALSALLTGRLNSARARAQRPVALLTLEWLRRLGEVRGPVRVGMARLDGATGADRMDARTREDADRWRLAQLADRTAGLLGGTGAAAWIGPDRVVWLEDPAGDRRVTPAWLQRSSGGLVRRVRTEEYPDGEQALLQAARTGLLGRPSTALLTTLLPVDAGAARRRFAALVPDGLVYAPDEPPPAALAALPGAELRAILADATAFARDLGVRRRRSRFDVTPLCAGGQLELIFVTGAHTGRRGRNRWLREIRALNLRAAVAGVRPRPAVSGG